MESVFDKRQRDVGEWHTGGDLDLFCTHDEMKRHGLFIWLLYARRGSDIMMLAIKVRAAAWNEGWEVARFGAQ